MFLRIYSGFSSSRILIALCLFQVSLIGTSVKAADQTGSEQPNAAPPPAESKLLVMDLIDIPASSGEVKLEGVLTSGKRFQKQVAIKEGTALIQWNGEEVEGMTFTVNAPGFQTYRQKFFKQTGQKTLLLKSEYTFRLHEGIDVGGKVVDKNSRPLSDVSVLIYVPGQSALNKITHFAEKQTTTDKQGQWKITGLPEDFENLSLKLLRKGYRSTLRTNKVLQAQYHQLKSLTDVRQLIQYQKLTGTIQDAQGNPVQGAMIFCSAHERSEYYDKAYPRSDATGQFEIDYNKTGKYELHVYSLQSGYSKTDISLPVTEPVAVSLKQWEKIEFHVVDEQRKPLSGVRVESCRKPDFYPQKTDCCISLAPFKHKFKLFTDQNGIAVWKQAPPEEIGYHFDKSTYTTPITMFKPRAEPYRIVMSPIQRLQIEAVDANTNEPIQIDSISHYFFSKEHPEGKPTNLWPYRSDDPKHSYAVFRDNKDWRCCVRTKGYRPGFSRRVPAEEFKGGWLTVKVPLVKSDPFQGVVLTPDGLPAEKAEIKTYNKDLSRKPPFQLGKNKYSGLEWDWTDKLTTNAKGVFQLPAHTKYYIARISHPTGFALLNDAELMEKPEIKLTPWVTLKGRIFSKGKPASTAEINLHRESRYFTLFCKGTSDENGNYTLKNCIPGTWVLGTYVAERKTFPNNRFELKAEIPGGKKEVHLDIGENSYTVLGKIQLVDRPDMKIEKQSFYLSLIQSKIKLPTVENSVSKLEAKLSTYLEPDGSFGVDQLLPYESELLIHLGDHEGNDHRSEPIKFIPRKTPEGHIHLGEINVKLTDEYLDWDRF